MEGRRRVENITPKLQICIGERTSDQICPWNHKNFRRLDTCVRRLKELSSEIYCPASTRGVIRPILSTPAW
jgi:hypothetical protein